MPDACLAFACHLARWLLGKAGLFIVPKPDDHFFKAQCPLCPSVWFNLMGNTFEENEDIVADVRYSRSPSPRA
jgi:hypothetical protein